MPSTSHLLSIVLIQLAVAATGTAEAQQSPLLDVQTTLHHATEDGCSQSFASTSIETTLHLTVSQSGDTTLKLLFESNDSMGPSFGSFQAGQRGFTHITTLERHEWTGRAVTQPSGALHITLDRDRTSRVVWQGYGSLPLPAPQTLQTNLVLECQPATLTVFPQRSAPQPGSIPGAGEVASSIPGYKCRVVSGAPAVLTREAVRSVPFAQGIALASFADDGNRMMIGSGDARLLRRR